VEGAGLTFEVKHPFTDLELPINAKKVIENTILIFEGIVFLIFSTTSI